MFSLYRSRFKKRIITCLMSVFLAPSTFAEGSIVNISTRSPIEVISENIMYAGFVIAGTGTKQVYIRAIGQGLHSLGVNTSLNPRIAVVDASTGVMIASNDDWGSGTWAYQISNLPTDTFAYSPPPAFSDAAMILDLPAGAYIAKVIPFNGNTTGVGIVAIDDIGGSSTAKLVNISTRSPIRQEAENYMYGGFIVIDAPKKFFVRAVGKGLHVLGVDTSLDPLMEIYDQKAQRTIASNDNWASDPSASELPDLFKTKSGITPDASDAGMIICLEPGVYSPVVKPMGGSSGVGIVAVDDLGDCVSTEPAYQCLGKVYCSEMTSCAEAMFYLQNCQGTLMDGDNDGIPCETQWCVN